MILDTDFIIDLLAGDEAARELAAELDRSGQSFLIPTMAILEVMVGVEESDADRVERVLDRYPKRAMDEQVARIAARAIGDGEMEVGSAKKNKGDAVIAATAIAEGRPVVTKNASHFESFGADVKTY